MPIPRSLLSRQAPTDHDLTVTRGHWPDELTGELVISAPHPSTFDGPHPFFGEGMTYRLSLQPGRHGAPAGALAWRQAVVDSPVGPPAGQAARPLRGHDGRRPLPLRQRQRRQHRAAAVGRPPVHDVGRRAPRRGRPGVAALPRRGRAPVRVAGASSGPQPVLPVGDEHRPPGDRPRPRRALDGQHCTGARSTSCAGTAPAAPSQRGRSRARSSPSRCTRSPRPATGSIVADCAFKVEPQVLRRRRPHRAGQRVGPGAPDPQGRPRGHPAGQPRSPCQTFELAPEINHYYATYDDTRRHHHPLRAHRERRHRHGAEARATSTPSAARATRRCAASTASR